MSLLDIMNEAREKAELYLVCSEHGLLVEEAEKMGVNSLIITCRKEIEKIRREKMIYSIIRNFTVLCSYMRYVYMLNQYVKRLKPDIIHANVPKSHIAAILLFYLNHKCIFIFHLREIFKKKTFSSMLYNWLLPSRRSLIIAISDAVRKTLPSRIKNHTIVLYNGINVPLKIPQKRSGKLIRFLYLGRIVPWKGCHLLIDAFYQLHRKTGDHCGTLDLIGDTLYWDQSYRKILLDKISMFDMAGKIRIFPHTSDPERVYLTHDILCMASDNEPFGRVAVEAMSYGLPVISFKSGGVCEIIRHEISGFLVEQDDIQAYVQTMEKFINDPSRIASMGRSGYAIARKEFNSRKNIPEIVDKMICLLEKTR